MKWISKNNLRNALYECITAKADIHSRYDKLILQNSELRKDLEQAERIRERIIKSVDASANGIDYWINFIVEWGKRKGWHEALNDSASIATKLLLIISELTEAFEEIRNGKVSDDVYYSQDEHGNAKPEGFPIEIADTCIRLFHLCGLKNIDLAKMIFIKMNYNELREYRHGGKKA